MDIFKNIQIAEEMGLPKQFAIRSRQKYLTKELRQVKVDVLEAIEALDCEYGLQYEFNYLIAKAAILQQQQINKELGVIKRMTKIKENGITDEMIEIAREYPVDRLIEFKRGNALAFCHDDRNPSLRYMNKTNKAWCPVCDKYYDAIAILMKRDMMPFKDAVKQLSGG